MKKFYRIVLLFIVSLTIPVFAEELESNCLGGDGTNCIIEPEITEREYSQDRFQADNNLVVDNDFAFSSFFAGNSVNINADVKGIEFIAGNSVNTNGSSDYLFVGGNQINFKEYITNDGFIAGNSITLDGIEARTLYIVGSNINIINSSIEELFIAGEDVKLNGNFDTITVSSEKLDVDGVIFGKLKINENASLTIKEDTTIGELEKYKEKETKKEFSKNNIFLKIVSKILSVVIKYVNYLIIGSLLIVLFKKRFEKLSKLENTCGYVFGKIGIGFVFLVFLPVASIIVMLTGFASFMGILLLLVYLASLFIATPVVSIHLGNKIFTKINNIYLRFILTLTIIEVLKLIPVLGGLTSFVVLLLGLGLLFDLFKNEKQEKKGK